MSESRIGDRSASFWEEVREYYDAKELTVRQILQKFDLTQGEFNYAKDQLGWRRRNATPVNRRQLIKRLFRMLDRMLTKLEREMTTVGEQEVAVLGRLVHSMTKLIALEAVAGTSVTERESKEMDSIRRKLVARIDELKRD